MAKPATDRSWRFGVFEVDTRRDELRRGVTPVKMREQSFRILVYLLEHPGDIVTREELRQVLWPSDTFVDFDHSLNTAVMKLRDALGDSTEAPLYIETIPKRGYRFIAPVEILPPPAQLHSQMASAEEGTKTSPARSVPVRPATLLLIALFAVVVIVPSAIFLVHRANGKRGAQTDHHLTEKRVTSNSPEAPVDSAVISPDGKFVAYSDPTGLYLRVIASGETRSWGLPKDFIATPNSWFPDGTHLLVMRWMGTPPTPSLWKLSLLGASPQKLIDNAVSGSVSPDGTRIAFGSFLPYWGSELWIMNADGANPHRIAEARQRANPQSGILSSAWSPNSRRIACVERHGFGGVTPAAEVSSLWTRDAELPVRASAFNVMHHHQTSKRRLRFSLVRPEARNRQRTFADQRTTIRKIGERPAIWREAPVMAAVDQIRFFSLGEGGAREDKRVTLSDWQVGSGDWSADGKGLLVPSFAPAGTTVILEVNRAGRASVVLEAAAGTVFDFMLQAPNGRYGILGAAVPGDNNVWMVDNL